jgi:dUTP pyrophosphatase
MNSFTNVKVEVERCKEGIELPKYTHEGDACMDLRVYPDEAIVIPAGKSHVFDTFLKVHFPKGYVMMVYPRSGLGIKNGVVLRNLTGVIDSNFSDTVKVGLVNTSSEDYMVSPGDRVAQFMVVPYPLMEITETTVEDTGRGAGIGSSGVA